MKLQDMLNILLPGLVLATVTVTAVATESRRLIASGWDTPTPARFRAEVAEFEKWGAFAGTTIAPSRRLPDGRQHDCRNAFSREPWDRSQFAEALADLQAARPVTATNNFLMVWANPGDVDWFDDAGWREIVNHWRLLAWLAKQGGLRGLCFDAEPYTKPYSQFLYTAQAQLDRHSFDEYRAKTRQRGREIMQAVVAEFPDVTFFTYMLLSPLLPLPASGNPAFELEGHTYGLQPAFFDGLLDVAPSTVTFVEGNENAYYYTRTDKFGHAFAELKLDGLRLIAPEHQDKFRAQYRVGHGIYLDSHANPPGSKYYLPPLNGSRAARLEANVTAAFQASDGYVWLWGEKARWWPGGNQAYPLWSRHLPGADGALLRAAKPALAARRALATTKPEETLLANSDFSVTKTNGAPAEWSASQNEDSKGRFTAREGAGCLTAMADGCFLQTVQVQSGERYAIAARARQTGRGTARLIVRWKTTDDRWTAEEQDRRLGLTHRDVWNELATVVVVPEGAGRLAVLLSAKQQTSDADFAQFDDVRLVRITE
jgi:hypothetical protein